ncbi:hypothetical protein HWV62_5026 [Athelia sp. TMB]|nr:hypothetical protein HWV62_5026 [Athelia sp. TMB]
MTRPRESLLNLFDPLNLNGPSTPGKRDGLRSPSSDKENSEPSSEPGQLTAFFNRTHAFQKASLAPMKPMLRLVDVGDVSVALDDCSEDDEGGAEEKPNRPSEAYGVQETPRREMSYTDDAETPMPRRAFVDASPEATPVAPRRTDAPVFEVLPQNIPCPASPQTISADHVAHASAHDEEGILTPLVLDPVHALADSMVEDVVQAAVPEALAPADIPLPPSPEPDQDPLASSTAYLIPSETMALLTEVPLSESISRPLSPPVSDAVPPIVITATRSRSRSPSKGNEPSRTRNHDRLSCGDIDADLHSFNIHLDNHDSSFDLLNDKISFFHGSGVDMDSTLIDAGSDVELDIPRDCGADGEDLGNTSMANFNVKDEENRMKAFLRMNSGCEDEPIIIPGVPEAAKETVAKTPQSKLRPRSMLASSTSSEFTPRVGLNIAIPKQIPSSPSPLMATPRSAIPKMKSSPIAGIPTFDSEAARTPSAAQTSTKTPMQPAFVAPRPVPALRIVKRANIPKPLASAPASAPASRLTPRRSMSISSLSMGPIQTGLPTPLATPTEPEFQSGPAPAAAPLRKPTLNGIRRPEPGAGSCVMPAPTSRPIGLGLKERLQGKKAAPSVPVTVPVAPATAKAPTGLSKLVRPQSVSAPLTAPPKELRQPSKFGYNAAPPAAVSVSRIPSVGAMGSKLPAPTARKVTATGRSSSTSSIPASKIGTIRRV